MSSPPAAPEPETGDRSRVERVTATLRATNNGRIALYAVLVALGSFYLAPLEAGIMTAFKTASSFNKTVPFAPPGPGGFTVPVTAKS